MDESGNVFPYKLPKKLIKSLLGRDKNVVIGIFFQEKCLITPQKYQIKHIYPKNHYYVY
jgi:hypothetical protein